MIINKKNVMLLLCFAILITGCKSIKNIDIIDIDTKKETTFIAMDTVMTLTIYGKDETLTKIKELITNLESKLSVTNEKSEIYNINKTKNATVSKETVNLVVQALSLCERTNGNLDISVYPILKEWGFTTGKYQIPSKSTIESKARYVNYKNIICDMANNTIILENNMEIDLGSVAKGYTGDCVVELLKSENVMSALLNLGGNIQALGHKPDGSMWKIGIQNPFHNEEYMGTLKIADEAVVTSGSYERYFVVDGTVYCHIIDPTTGMSIQNGLTSVTIVGESGIICDGLSTALFVMGLEEAIEFWKESNDFEAIFITEDGKVTITEGLIERFSLLETTTKINQEMEIIYRE